MNHPSTILVSSEQNERKVACIRIPCICILCTRTTNLDGVVYFSVIDFAFSADRPDSWTSCLANSSLTDNICKQKKKKQKINCSENSCIWLPSRINSLVWLMLLKGVLYFHETTLLPPKMSFMFKKKFRLTLLLVEDSLKQSKGIKHRWLLESSCAFFTISNVPGQRTLFCVKKKKGWIQGTHYIKT